MNNTTQYGAHDVIMPMHHDKKRTLVTVGIIFVVIAALATVLYIYFHKKVYTMDELETMLVNVSTPVTATPEEQAKAMKALEASAPAPTATLEEREAELNRLSQ